MDHSQEINEISKALKLAQVELKQAKKDSNNPHFGNNYADLSSVWDACGEALANNGLSVAQLPGKDELGPFVGTMLMHDSGQWISSKTYTPMVKDSPQALGSAITYGRRYGLSAMVGIRTADDDAEGAEGRGKSPQETAQPKKKTTQEDDL